MSGTYDELYLPLAQRNLGDMYDYAINTLHYKVDEFHSMFLMSGMAHQFEIGNPTYIAGKNGCEIAKEVILTAVGTQIQNEDIMYLDKSPEYWIGWVLAYYQWYSGQSFGKITKAVPFRDLYAMYPTYHEADIQQFIQVMNERTETEFRESRLKRLRGYWGLSQSGLAKKSEVPLRQIQLFEQGQRDIEKAQVKTVYQLAKALRCEIEDLISGE